MATITEDYVSFETARLLKEKGFNEICSRGYGVKNKNLYISVRSNDDNSMYAAPTQQMAMRWLREVHNIGIFPSTYTITNSKGSKEEHVYGSAIVNLITFDLMCDDIMPRNSYEEACEAAIKYSLENLI